MFPRFFDFKSNLNPSFYLHIKIFENLLVTNGGQHFVLWLGYSELDGALVAFYLRRFAYERPVLLPIGFGFAQNVHFAFCILVYMEILNH